MVQVLPFQIDLGPAQFFRESPGIVERCLAARILSQIILEFLLKELISLRLMIGLFQFNESRHQRLSGVAASKDAEMTFPIG